MGMDTGCEKIDEQLFRQTSQWLLHMGSDNFYYMNKPPGTKAPPPDMACYSLIAHRHPYDEIFVVLDGMANIMIEGRSWLGRPGDVCFLQAGCFHDIGYLDTGAPSRILWLALLQKRLRLHISEYAMGKYRVLDGLDMEFDPYLFDQVNLELRRQDEDFLDYTKLYLTALWHIAWRSYIRQDSYIVNKNQWHMRICLEIEEYVFDHITEKITLADISNITNLSPGYISQLFKELRGVNLFEFIMDEKINHAKELLDSSKRNISEIAYMIGFTDPFYFSKVFKKHTGLSPRDYRACSLPQGKP